MWRCGDHLPTSDPAVQKCLSVSVYYVAVRTIVLSRQGSNLGRACPVIIHDIIHGRKHLKDLS